MGEVSYKGHRYPSKIIDHCVWLYFQFTLSLRDIEELMLERGVVVSYETVRRWCAKFGHAYANRRRHRPPARPGDTWHLDEVFLSGSTATGSYLWRAVDQDGIVLDVLVQSRRNAKAAKRFFRKLLKGQCASPRNAARLPVKPSRRLLEFPVVLQWLGSEALPNFVADNFVADKHNNGSHVHNFAHPSRYCHLKTVRSVIVVRAARFGRHRRVGPKADAPPQYSGKPIEPDAARRRRWLRQAWASFESRSSKVTSIRSKPLARWALACPA